jgi:outer membrane protein assembly factor BamA
VFDAVLDNRFYDHLNRQYAIGGDDRLRGYPSGDPDLKGGEAQRGNDALVFNTEFRSTAIDVLSAQCGFALFHDAGDAADALSRLELRHSVGAGLRVLFPQANRIVFRADWAFPLSAGYETLPGALFVTFGQAFLMPELLPPSSLASFLE